MRILSFEYQLHTSLLGFILVRLTLTQPDELSYQYFGGTRGFINFSAIIDSQILVCICMAIGGCSPSKL
jgi:hypothetical protein